MTGERAEAIGRMQGKGDSMPAQVVVLSSSAPLEKSKGLQQWLGKKEKRDCGRKPSSRAPLGLKRNNTL